MRKVCWSTIEAYISEIAEMTVTSQEHSELSNKMADALARIDPNTKNGTQIKLKWWWRAVIWQ